MLIPEALMAVATVALLYAAVRRISGPNAGLLAGAAFALTPVAALMFRYNNPDAVMVLLMMAAVYCAVRALEHASARWIARPASHSASRSWPRCSKASWCCPPSVWSI